MDYSPENHHYLYLGKRLQSSKAGDRWTCFINENYVGIDTATEAEAIALAKTQVQPCPPHGSQRSLRSQ